VTAAFTLLEMPCAVARGPHRADQGGLPAATKSLADRVNAISAGTIATPMHADDDTAALAAMHPLGRMGTLDDIVAGARYLETSTSVAGAILHIDGGQSAGH
jgi:NAD(P)-dependent dehydrogenase (short-subunit alcohol dehydrogenase family)